MLAAEQFTTAIAAARSTAALDSVARLLWKAHAEGQIADADASAAAEAVQARRAGFARPAAGVALASAVPASARRRPPRSPDRQASLERRRRCAASGALPPQLAAAFTTGEIAALSVIARAIREAGVCVLPLDKIAALAGVSRTTAQNAIRAAKRLGLLQRIERRRRGLPSFTNVLRIVSAEWLSWLRHGRQGGVGFRSLNATDNNSLSKGKKPVPHWRTEAVHTMFLLKQRLPKGGRSICGKRNAD